MLFENPYLNVASFVFILLILLTVVGYIPFMFTKKEVNRLKYGGTKPKKFKVKERQVNEFLDVFK